MVGRFARERIIRFNLANERTTTTTSGPSVFHKDGKMTDINLRASPLLP